MTSPSIWLEKDDEVRSGYTAPTLHKSSIDGHEVYGITVHLGPQLAVQLWGTPEQLRRVSAVIADMADQAAAMADPRDRAEVFAEEDR